MAESLRVALVDDDEAVLDSLRLYLSREGLTPLCFRSADIFLAERATIGAIACIVADVRMPGTSGLDLVQRLAAESDAPPIVLITGHGDIDMAVAAIKLGAADFIEKPFDEARLLDSIRTAARATRQRAGETAQMSELRKRYDLLSERQRQVMALAASGMLNKDIGQRLGISPRTVEIHRAWMMQRMGAANLAELVRMEIALKAER